MTRKKTSDLASDLTSEKNFAAGTITIGSVTYVVKGAATLPTFKIEEGVTVGLMILGEMVAKQKMKKGEAILDPETGEAMVINIIKVVNIESDEVGQIVAGVVLARALSEYPGGYVGKTFAITKHAAPAGQRAKPWSVFEIDAK